MYIFSLFTAILRGTDCLSPAQPRRTPDTAREAMSSHRITTLARFFRASAAALCLLLAAMAGTDQAGGQVPLESEALKKARSLYRARCAGCHGRRGTSKAATGVDFTSPGTAARMRAGGDLEDLLANRASGHPTVTLTPAEQGAIAAYIREQLLPVP